MKNKIVILNSGGFDSTFLLVDTFNMRKDADLYSLYFSYGQNNDALAQKKAELNAGKYCVSHKVVKLPKIDWSNNDFFGKEFNESKSQYLEARNLIFLSYATSYAESIGAGEIYAALIRPFDPSTDYPDTSKRFIKKMDRLCREFGVRFTAPLITTTKGRMCEVASKLNLFGPDDFISCDTPKDNKPCGVCRDCRDSKIYRDDYNKIWGNIKQPY